MCHVALETMVPNICGSVTQTMLRGSLLRRRNLSRFLDFWKICRPLHNWQLIPNKTCTILYGRWVRLFQYNPTATSCERTFTKYICVIQFIVMLGTIIIRSVCFLRDCECRTELSALQRSCLEKMGYLLFLSEALYKKY